MRELLAGLEERRASRGRSVSRTRTRSAPCPRSTAPSTTRSRALEETVGHELNFAGENALIVPEEDIALPERQPARGATGQRHRRTADRAGVIGGADRGAGVDPARRGPHRAAAVPGPPSWSRVGCAGARVHRSCGGGRGPLAGDPGGGADRLGVPRRRIALQPRADRGPARPRDAARLARRSSPRSSSSPCGRCGWPVRSPSAPGPAAVRSWPATGSTLISATGRCTPTSRPRASSSSRGQSPLSRPANARRRSGHDPERLAVRPCTTNDTAHRVTRIEPT